MSDHTTTGLRAALKSLKEVVAPAVDPANPLAVEQLRMVCSFLGMVCEQLPLRGERIRFDLRSAIGLAEALTPAAMACGDDVATALAAALTPAVALAAAPGAAEGDIQQATARLGAASSALIRASAGCDEHDRALVERAVLANAKPWLDVQRAWFAPVGFDSEASRLLTLAGALARPPADAEKASA